MQEPFSIDDEIGVDLTPLIDVVFMLLIFFIMTTTFNKPILDVVLPSSEHAETGTTKQEELIISIDKDGAFHHKDVILNLEELEALLAQDTERLLNLFVDKESPFEAFVSVVDMAKDSRGGRFVISTEAK
ncbi:MAG: biopolymer transporter ExbD [Pseudomonadota bacterium]